MSMYNMTENYTPNQDFLRVATATPVVAIADVNTNLSRIIDLYNQAVEKQVSLVVFPELCITGYSIQDLVRQPNLLNKARKALLSISDETNNKNTAIIVGLPFSVGNAIYNCGVFIADGEIKGIIPKQFMPNYNEFYEKRWFQAWNDKPNTTVKVGNQNVMFGRNQLFDINGTSVGIEICEDLWVPEPPNINLVKNGAIIIANPSASPEAVTKTGYRRELVSSTAARLESVYIYSGADQSESTSEIVMSGHSIINELGRTLNEHYPFSPAKPLMIADIDTQHIIHDRQKTTDFPNEFTITPTPTNITAKQTELMRDIDGAPFIPKGSPENIKERLDTIINIQATGLAMRLKSANIKKVVLGLSGGLDSTLALLIAIKSSEILGLNPGNLIYTLTMPGVSSSDRTQNNAVNLATSLKIPNDEIPIAKLSKEQLTAIKHAGEQDITYENTQARIRQALIFNKANQIGGLALGTGDLSEIALGWCTYNGDHMSGYNVNASIPKTLVRSLVRHAAEGLDDKSKKILHDILDTPVSPELTGNGKDISQATEDIVGPYELHDFFLYHFVRWAEPKQKISYLAKIAFKDKYSDVEIDKWLDVFFKRFFNNQWKRQAMPDGAKVGISLSPKGDWRMAPETKIDSFLL